MGESSVLIAGRVPFEIVAEHMRQARPVFHSEHDLRVAFVRSLWALDPDIEPRLEVGQNADRSVEALDLLCLGPGAAETAVEFKYFKAPWVGMAGSRNEEFHLRDGGADDRARRFFVEDIERLERFCSGRPQRNGIALMITNSARLWEPPISGRKPTQFEQFRLHEGNLLTGTRVWADGRSPRYNCTLRGEYALRWQPHSDQGGVNGCFKSLAVFIEPCRGAGPQHDAAAGLESTSPTGPEGQNASA